jgi:hypothetical protein
MGSSPHGAGEIVRRPLENSRAGICREWMSPEERERWLREIYGRPPKTPDSTATDRPESSPVNGQESAQIKPNENTDSQPAKTTV